MNFEEKVVNSALLINKEIFEKSIERGDIKSFKQMKGLIEEAKKRIDNEANVIVKNSFENKTKEYKSLISDKEPMFQAVFEIAKNDYIAPKREEDEGLLSFLRKSQDTFDQLEREIGAVRCTLTRFEKLEKIYERKKDFKKMVNDDLENLRNKAVHTTLNEMIEHEKIKLHLPIRYLTQLVNEVVQEKLEKQEYEKLNGGVLSPIVHYRGKRINAGRIFLGLKNLRERGSHLVLKKEDVEALHCEDFNTYVEWLDSMKDVYNMDVEKIGDRMVYCRKR